MMYINILIENELIIKKSFMFYVDSEKNALENLQIFERRTRN